MNLRAAISFRGRRLLRRIRLMLARPVLDRSKIVAVLKSMPDNRRPIVMVHSSLSACGKVRGGTAAVISALLEWIDDGTLAMPTHTYCYPDELGRSPVFDPARSPSMVGAVSDAFWRRSDVLRSLHPSHSLAATGPSAEDLVVGHELTETPCGAGTPYEKLVNEDAGVLMYGAALNSYTLFHTAEALASVPYLYFPHALSLRIRSGNAQVREIRMRRQDMNIPRRFAEMDSWLQERGLLHRARCGKGEILWMPHSQAVHQALLKALRSDPWLLVSEEDRPHSISGH